MLHVSASTTSGFPVQQQSQALVMERVRGEFREMPGLALTLAQAGKLWSLDAQTCAETLTALVSSGFLYKRADGAFCRVSDLNSRSSRTAHS